MENYEPIMTLLTSYTSEELDMFIIFLKEFKRINTKKVNRPHKQVEYVDNPGTPYKKEMLRRLKETTPEHETIEEYNNRKRAIRRDVEDNWIPDL
jgi:hypothetical protein